MFNAMVARNWITSLALLLAVAVGTGRPQAQPAGGDEDPGFGGPPPFGPPGFGPGGPGQREEVKLVKQFDKDNNGWLNAEERAAARKSLQEKRSAGAGARGRFGGPGFGPGGPGGWRGGPGGEAAPQPGMKVSKSEVASGGDAPLYASNVVRTVFLQFATADWEKELEDFHETDVEVAAEMTVDGKSYQDVGVRFRGNTSYGMVATGGKRPLNISVDMAHEGQDLMGFRTLNLLNAHEDTSMLHTVLAMQMARDYFPAPRANFVRLVINGENWGVYVNVEQFNKDYLRDRYSTTKGVRWKVPGNPGARGGLEYLGDDVTKYRAIYEVKSKDEPKAWTSLINLCKVLNETPAEELQSKLSAVLDIDQALRFLAWDNVLAGGDGFWTRASDYCMYEDPKGRFHLVPYDVNETFSLGGGPGFGPPGDFGRRGGRGGGPEGFGPGMFLAPAVMERADKNEDRKLSATEFNGFADGLFDAMDPGKSGKASQEQFVAGLNEMFAPPQGMGQFGPPGGGRGGFGPGMFVGPGMFTAADTDKDGGVTRGELQGLFEKWYQEWNVAKADGLDEEAVRDGMNKSLPRPEFGGPGRPGGQGGPQGGRRGPGGPPGFGGPGGGPGRGGATLDPLVSTNDTSKPLISKLLGVPELRAKYLGYVRHMAETWLNWDQLGPIAKRYQDLIREDVKADAKKFVTAEQFQAAVEGGEGSLKAFAEQRRAYLLGNPNVKSAKAIDPK